MCDCVMFMRMLYDDPSDRRVHLGFLSSCDGDDLRAGGQDGGRIGDTSLARP